MSMSSTRDSYRLKPNLTITYGLRYSLFLPPWETNGTEVTPTISLGNWFQQRAEKMLSGGAPTPIPPFLRPVRASQWREEGILRVDYKNFAPRLAFAYSPRASDGWLKSLFGEGIKPSSAAASVWCSTASARAC